MQNKDSFGACLDPSKSLPIDTACLNVFNKYDKSISVYAHFQRCFTCTGELLGNVSANSNHTFQISTKHPLHTYYTSPKQWCHGTETYKQYGRYGWNITGDGQCSEIYTIIEPPNPYLPLFAALMIYLTGLIIVQTSKLIVRTVRIFISHQSADTPNDLNTIQESEGAPQLLTVSKTGMRLQALDAFRGIAVLLMIFVNNGGGKYVFLNHSPWFGITIADLVLPWFCWTMGFSIVNSIRLQLRVSLSRTRLVLKQLRRTVILIMLGLMVNSQHNNVLSELRFPGVLQLLAVSYFLCSFVETCFTSAQRNFQYGRLVFLQDILERWPQWLIVVAIVIVHSCITFLLPVPGCPTGYLGAGGWDHYGDYKNCTGGAAGYIDRLLFGKHVYMKKHDAIFGPTLPHDPEGLMNTLSATLIVFMGVQAGRIYVTYYQTEGRVLRWLTWFALTASVAGILCNFTLDEGRIPLSKNMMTLSFVLFTSSLAFLLFAILYFVIDHKKWWAGSPFIYSGANPILLYIGHYLAMNLFPFTWETLGTPTHTSELAINLWTTTIWGFIAYLLYKKEFLLSV